jgi:predicted GTPase
MADIVIINKVDSANPADVEAVARNVSMINPRAALVRQRCPYSSTSQS